MAISHFFLQSGFSCWVGFVVARFGVAQSLNFTISAAWVLWNLSLSGGFIPARSASEGVRRGLAGRRRRRIVSRPCCPRHSRPIRTLSLALRACIPDPTTTGERNTKKAASEGVGFAFLEACIPARSAERTQAAPRFLEAFHTSPKRKRGGRAIAQEERRRRIGRRRRLSASLPADPDPLACASGLYFRNHRRARRLPSYQPEAQARGSASARSKTGGDVLRALHVVRVTPGRSGPSRLRFGLVFQTRPRLVSATPKRAGEGVGFRSIPARKRKRGGPRERSQ